MSCTWLVVQTSIIIVLRIIIIIITTTIIIITIITTIIRMNTIFTLFGFDWVVIINNDVLFLSIEIEYLFLFIINQELATFFRKKGVFLYHQYFEIDLVFNWYCFFSIEFHCYSIKFFSLFDGSLYISIGSYFSGKDFAALRGSLLALFFWCLALMILVFIFVSRFWFFMEFDFNYIYFNSCFVIPLVLCFLALILLRVVSLMELSDFFWEFLSINTSLVLNIFFGIYFISIVMASLQVEFIYLGWFFASFDSSL